MPLRKGYSRSIISSNIRELHTGSTYAHTAGKFGKKDADRQAVAIALEAARQAKRRKRADGGGIFDYSGVGEAMPEAYGADSPIRDPLVTVPKSVLYDLPKKAIDQARENPLPGLRREDYTDLPPDTSPDPKSALGGIGVAVPRVGWQPVDPMVGSSLEAASNVMGGTALSAPAKAAGEVVAGAGPMRRAAQTALDMSPEARAARAAELDDVDRVLEQERALKGASNEPRSAEAAPLDRGAVGGPSGGGEGFQQARMEAERRAAGREPLAGLPTGPQQVNGQDFIPGPFGRAHDVAERYMADKDFGTYAAPDRYHPIDPEHSAAIADAYDKMKHAPNDPAVKNAYEALINETKAQYQAIKDSGLKITPVGAEDYPYHGNPRAVAQDVADNNHMAFFKTNEGFGVGEKPDPNHPMLRSSGEKIGDHDLLNNDLFRIVHDYFGHVKNGYGFRAAGEDNAWRAHAAMYSDLARPAMTAETRGQNSWLNYGPHGEFNRTASGADTIYAPQKVGLMPDWTMYDKGKAPEMMYHGSRADYTKPDLSKIGSGQGEMAYGAGYYGSQKEKVAKRYRDMQADTSWTYKGSPASLQHAFENMHDSLVTMGASPGVAQHVSDSVVGLMEHGFTASKIKNMVDRTGYEKEFDAALKLASKYKFENNPGHMYKWAVEAEPEKFIDWDKPFEKQSPFVQEKLAKHIEESVASQRAALQRGIEKLQKGDIGYRAGRPGGAVRAQRDLEDMQRKLQELDAKKLPGRDVYKRLGLPANDQAEAYTKSSQRLKEMGIPGIHYKDTSSTAGDAGVRNFVVWDPSVLRLLRKYGIAGVPAAGAAAGAMQDEHRAAGGRAVRRALRRAGGGAVDYDPMTGLQIGGESSEEAAPDPQGPLSRTISRLTGTQFGEPRAQLWPEKMIRSGATLAGDVLSGKQNVVPPGLRREDYTDIPAPSGPTEDSTWLGRTMGWAPVAAQPNDPMMERAQDMAGLAGGQTLLTGAREVAPAASRALVAAADSQATGAPLAAVEHQFRKLSGPAESDPGYVYHATNIERAHQIAEEGLKRHKPHEFTDQSVWPDGSKEKRNYFTGDARNTWQFAPEEGTPTLLRVKRDAHEFKGEKGTGDLYSTKDVPPEKIEYQSTDGQWKSLRSDSSEAGAPLAALEHAPAFYSGLERAVEAMPQAKMPANQVLAALANKGGIKGEEVAATGLDRFLAEKGPASVTKQELLDHVSANKVQLGEVTKGEEASLPWDKLPGQEQYKLLDKYRSIYGKEEHPDDVVEWYENNRSEGETPDSPKYAGYQLPGGESYREKLFTMPSRGGPAETEFYRLYNDAESKYGDVHAMPPEEKRQLAIAQHAMQAEKDSKGGTAYKSSHWDEPNVLVHRRTNEREVNGVPSLHLEEIQSDWHQAGRKSGYDDPVARKAVEDKLGNAGYPVSGEDARSAAEDGVITPQEAALIGNRSYIPDAPFKKNWHELALKDAIREAAEKGLDRISWTPGEAQAARYDLSKQIQKLELTHNKDGVGELIMTPKKEGVQQRIPVPIKSKDDLVNAVGKDLADKLYEQGYQNNGKAMLQGLDLKVGGEGMKGFYDKMIPDALNKIGKPHGVKVERGEVPVKTIDTFGVYDRGGNLLHEFKTASDAHHWDMMNPVVGGGREIKQISTNKGKQPVHYMDIPQSLKDQALKKGFSLFEDSATAGAPLSAAEASARKRDPEMWHDISKIKLPKPISEMSAVHTPTQAAAERVVAPASMQGGNIMPLIGDRTRAGSQLTRVNGFQFEQPVEMQGGHGFMAANADRNAAWASGKSVANGLRGTVKREAGDKPLYGSYTAMSERSSDFSHHVSDTLAEMLKHKELNKSARREFDDAMRKLAPTWPGVKDYNLRKYLLKAPGAVRAQFAKLMDTAKYQNKGFPSVAEARFAVTDPRLLHVKTGASGQSIARLDPSGHTFSAPNQHLTYDTNLAGKYHGGLPESVPKEIMYPDIIKPLERYRDKLPGYKPTLDYLMSRSPKGIPRVQPATQEWVDNLSKYLESKGHKFAKGGGVEAALKVAREIKRSKGGAVHVGPIVGNTGGRADKVPMEVPDGCYVLVADLVSGLGEGNTQAGFQKLSRMFPKSKPSLMRQLPKSKVKILAADGEFVVSVQDILDRFGDLDTGHRTLDAWQIHERKNLIKTLEALPGPAQD